MKAYALIVGIQSYNVKPLDNAVKDAEGMAQKMLSLGYIVDLQTEAIIEDIGRNRQTLWGGCTDANPKLLLNDT